jgi:signal-transduction protein with cAMP-binding, CBS, and nucleotidyltransferase domain
MDPHEIRMVAGERSMAMIEAMDEESLESAGHVIEALQDLVSRLADRGLPRLSIASYVTGIVTGLVLDLPADED